MNIKKLAVSSLAVAMLAGCSGKTSAPAESAPAEGSKDIAELKMLFVPSRDPEVIKATTANLPALLKDALAEEGYNVGEISIDVSAGSDYSVAGEALASGAADIAWLPAGTYIQFQDEVQVILTATRDALSHDETDPMAWNGEANATTRVTGEPVTYYRGLIYAGPSEKGRELAAKVENGEELTWEDLNSASWAVASTTSSSGYVFPTLWLMDHYDGKKITDLERTTQTNYSNAFAQAAAGGVDIVLCYADGRMDYGDAWTRATTETDDKGAAGFGRTDSIFNEMSVIGVTEKIYNDTVCVTKAKPEINNEEFQTAFQNALMKVAGTEEGKEIIKVYSHTGYVAASESDYADNAEQMAKASN